MHIIIDGYNLIFQCGLNGRSAASDALEKSRKRLLGELSLYLDDAQCQRTTLVFDAKDRPIKAELDQFKHEGIQVSFAVSHPDADSLIEDLIRQHSTPKQLLIVSSDHRLHKAAQRRRARAIDSDEWYEGLVEGRYYEGQRHSPASAKPLKRSANKAQRKKAKGKGDGKEVFDLLTDEEIAALELDVQNHLMAKPKPSAQADESKAQPEDSPPPFENPFPPGYGEDLLDH